MCAGNPGKGICQGDSGGPLYDKENNVLVGVTSFSSLQCSELPSGFSNVASQVRERFFSIFSQTILSDVVYDSGLGSKKQYVTIMGSIILPTSARHFLRKSATKEKRCFPFKLKQRP
jgi:hypothetical protein